MDVQIIDRNPYGRNISEGDAWVDKCYQAVIRRFHAGSVEVVTRLIDPLRYKRFNESAQYGGLVSYLDREGAPEKTDEERARENFIRATRRAKQGVRWAVKSIGADHLVTLTYRSPEGQEMKDFERLKRDWKEFCRLVRKGLPAFHNLKRHDGIKDWRFVAVPELQQNGAYHLHVAVCGRQDINFLRRCWYVAAGGEQDASGERTPGAINVRGPSKRWGSKTNDWRPNKLSGYMTKYLSKTFEETAQPKGAKRYWSGRSNEKPEVVRYWLKAQDFVSAIIESHAIFRHERPGGDFQLWASNGYDLIWFSG